MRRSYTSGNVAPVVLALCLFLLPSASRAVDSFEEDFGTKQYCDTLNTTALWDTVAGTLGLHAFEVDLAGSFDTYGFAHGVAVSGDQAYVADYDAGLKVIDISNPGAPTSTGGCGTPGSARGVVVSGDYAYVADTGSGLRVIDISSPGHPSVVGGYDTPGNAVGIAVSGDYAYVADMAFGLQIIDISNPTSPSFEGNYDTPYVAYAVFVSGNRAYVADADSGLKVIDVSNPASPTLTGSYDTPGVAMDVAVWGDYAYVADQASGLQVIDISDPTNPTLAGSYNTAGWAYALSLCGDRVYVADYDAGLQVIDISNPGSPTLVGGYDTPGQARGVAVSGHHAYVGDYDYGLQVIEVSKPVLPPLPAGSYDTPGGTLELALSGDYAYVAEDNVGLLVVDISNPSAPAFAGSRAVPSMARGVAVSGDYAYVAAYSSGLVVIDISDPTNPDSVGDYDTYGQSRSVAISGHHAFVADGDSGLQVIDITLPSAPAWAGKYVTSGVSEAVAVSGDYAYLVDRTGLQVINISDVTAPTLAGSYTTPGNALWVDISGDYAYVADYYSGLQVIDISVPASPSLAGSYSTSGNARSVAVSGAYAFVATELSGLEVIDISNPASPTLAGKCDTPDAATGIAVAGEYAYIADYTSGLQVLQIFDSGWDLDENAGQSLVFFESADPIAGVKLAAVQADSVYWHVSADSGTSWTEVPPDGAGHRLSSAGGDLLWKSTHLYREHGVNPVCSLLEIVLLYNYAVVDSIVDVPSDQGGWARIYFTRSGLDFADEPAYPIADYFVFRRIDDIELVSEILEKAEVVNRDVVSSEFPVNDGEQVTGVLPSLNGAGLLTLADRYFVVTDYPVSAGLPPGTWEVVGSVPAHQEDQYICLIPTLADSTSQFFYSVYCISAETTTPSVYYFSPPDSGYSVDNLSPAPPEGLEGDYSYPPAELLISWDSNSESDLSRYAVYKGTHEGFVPDESNRLGTTSDTLFVDDSFDPNLDNYYKVSAWDIHENESAYSLLRPEEITGVGGLPAVPMVTHLEQNVPNPFNPVTKIRFSIAEPGWVSLVVYDVAGRTVRTLVQGRRDVDRYEVMWDGREDNGGLVASGVYLYELVASGHEETKKMVLLR